jgi:hypothetical protein
LSNLHWVFKGLYYVIRGLGRSRSVGIAIRYVLVGPGTNLSGDEIFRTLPYWTWGPTSLLYDEYRVVPGSKAAGRGVDYPPSSCSEVRERVELYLYSPCGPSWHVIRRTLHFVLCNLFFFDLLK